jgi:hypothetical protein
MQTRICPLPTQVLQPQDAHVMYRDGMLTEAALSANGVKNSATKHPTTP